MSCRPSRSTKCVKELLLTFSNSIIRASTEKGSPQKSLLDFATLLSLGLCRPDHRTFSLVLKACRLSSLPQPATQTHARMLKSGLQSHPSISSSLFLIYLHNNLLSEALPLLDEMLDPTYGNLMMAALLRNGELEKANRVFSKMPIRDLVSWNSIIAGFARKSNPKEALMVFRRMLSSGLEPDCFTFSATLSACARAGALSHGKWVHKMMEEKEPKFESNPILNSALIDMYSKCGRIEVAWRIFESVDRAKVSVWNSMITGLAIHGLGGLAMELLSRMQKEGIDPDSVTFIGILTALSHCGMVEEGQYYFDEMKRSYSIEPRIEHYGAMVDGLARAGRLDEAHEMIMAMPAEPDIVVWRALLSGCRRHRRPDLAELVVRQMAKCGSGDYVMMSSIYSSLKRFDQAERVWGVMKERKVRKGRGLSWVESGGRLHQFKAGGDRSHPESGAIYRKLDELMERAKEEGFMAMTEIVTMDVDEEEKEENLRWHSEKLAVAYCVLRTEPGSEIRVSKNLQTCSDCHEWMKVVSKVLGRTIVVRDRVRFHRFEIGSCSCNDYW